MIVFNHIIGHLWLNILTKRMSYLESWKKNLYTVWLAMILCISSFFFGLPFLPLYIQELGIKNPESINFYTGLMNMLPAIAGAIMAPVWGITADRWGKRFMLLRAMF